MDERDDRLEAYALANEWREDFYAEWDGSVDNPVTPGEAGDSIVHPGTERSAA